jgi:hypothetical protein
MNRDPRRPTDRRARQRREQRRLFVIVAVFVVFVGSIVICLVYGPEAVPLGLTCLSAGVAVLLFLWLVLSLVERWAKD